MKTIRPQTTVYSDVVFLDFDGSTIKVHPGTWPYGSWVFPEKLEDIFRARGDYYLRIEVTAKAMPATITRELKFHYDGEASTLELMPENYDPFVKS
jgi:hypothetical protein